MVHEQMMRFFQGFRRDAHPMAVMVASVGALSAFYHDSTDIADPQQRMIASHAHDRQDADDRGDGLQILASASPSFIRRTTSTTRRTSCACASRCPCEEYKRQPGAGARDGPHLHPARRPRAERLDLDGAPGRFVGRQPLRLHRGRHRLPVGPGAWRRQRSGAEDAAGDRLGRPHPGLSSRAPRTRTIRSA